MTLRIFNGDRQLFPLPAQFFVTITDGNQSRLVWQEFPQNEITFSLPFYNNFGDDYTVLVSRNGYQQAGFTPVNLSDRYATTLDIMLIPKQPQFNFAAGLWAAADAAYPFLAVGAKDAVTAASRYNDLMEQEPASLACVLNLCEAMSQIPLAQGTPLTYIKQIIWHGDTLPSGAAAPAQDRFFAWCDEALLDQVRQAAARNQFAVEVDPGLLHPGATASWKQIQFGEANVQLTFHEADTATIDGVSCVLLEPDIDYYKDPLAHALFEVVVNTISHTLTDPAVVYVLRWIAGQTAGVPAFAPLYTIR